MVSKVLLYRPSGKKTYDITPICELITIGGDITKCARECEIVTPYSLLDKSHQKIFPSLGDLITVYEGKVTLFWGMIMDRTMSNDQKSTFIAFDPIIHLTKSTGTYNFKKAKPESIATQIVREAGLNIGNIINTGIPIDLLADSTSFYDTIIKAYYKASLKTKKQYMPIMLGSKFYIVEKGAMNSNLIISADTNLTNFEYNDSIQDMVNRVKIYSDKGKYLGKVDAASWISAFGVFQQVIQKEEKKDPKAEAKSMLKGSQNTFSVECRGISSCKTGYAVRVQIPYLDITRNQNMYIDGDTHTYNLGLNDHSMQLQLSFKNQMDNKED